MIIMFLTSEFKLGRRKFHSFGVGYGDKDVDCFDVGFLRVMKVNDEEGLGYVARNYVTHGGIDDWHEQVRRARRIAASKARAEEKQRYEYRSGRVAEENTRLFRENIKLRADVETLTNAIEIVKQRSNKQR